MRVGASVLGQMFAYRTATHTHSRHGPVSSFSAYLSQDMFAPGCYLAIHT